MFKDVKNLIEEAEIKALMSYCIFPDPDKLDKVIAQYKSKSDHRLYGIVVENQVVGIVGYKQLSSDVIEIQHISVSPQYRGGGYGRGLVLELLNTEKPAKIIAETDGDAVDFYRRIGFKINSLGEKYPGVERYLCFYLVDDLGRKNYKKHKGAINMARFNKASQVILVSDLNRSKEYYRDKLGFTIDGQFVERDGISFLLKEIENEEWIRPNHTINGFMESYWWVDDADHIYEELKARGALVEEPITRDYGMRDFILYDIDGYRFCIGGPV